MKCDKCGEETSKNFGKPATWSKEMILCKECRPTEESIKDIYLHNYLLGAFGILSMIGGFYLLIFSPSSSGARIGTDMGVVNLHDMFFGLALSVVGAIFVAAQWRPR